MSHNQQANGWQKKINLDAKLPIRKLHRLENQMKIQRPIQQYLALIIYFLCLLRSKDMTNRRNKQYCNKKLSVPFIRFQQPSFSQNPMWTSLSHYHTIQTDRSLWGFWRRFFYSHSTLKDFRWGTLYHCLCTSSRQWRMCLGATD